MLVSSHVLGEVQHTVDDVVIIAHGRLVHASSLAGSRTWPCRRPTSSRRTRPRCGTCCASHGWAGRAEGAGVVLPGVPAADVGCRGVRPPGWSCTS